MKWPPIMNLFPELLISSSVISLFILQSLCSPRPPSPLRPFLAIFPSICPTRSIDDDDATNPDLTYHYCPAAAPQITGENERYGPPSYHNRFYSDKPSASVTDWSPQWNYRPPQHRNRFNEDDEGGKLNRLEEGATENEFRVCLPCVCVLPEICCWPPLGLDAPGLECIRN